MSLLVLGPCYGMDAMFKKIMKQTAKHTFDAACFGETNKNNYDLAVGAAIEKCLQLAWRPCNLGELARPPRRPAAL